MVLKNGEKSEIKLKNIHKLEKIRQLVAVNNNSNQHVYNFIHIAQQILG